MNLPSQLCNMGFRFIKLKPKSKVPIQPKWQTENNYRFDELKHHNGNIGVVAGYGKLRIIDCDKKEFACKMRKALPQTFAVKTGSGGLHLYLISNYDTNHTFANGLGEFRAQNTQVVAPGCIHPNGNKYEVLIDVPIAEIEAEKLKEIIEPYLRPEIPETTAQQEGLKDNSRSGREFKEVIKLCYQGLTKPEVFEKMKAFKKWSEAPKQYRELTYNKAFKYVETKKSQENTFKVETLQAMLDRDIQKIDWIIDKLIARGGVNLIAGASNSYKTWIAQYLALCCATGKPFLGEFETESCNVLYLDEENGEIRILNRFNFLKYGSGFHNNTFDNIFVSTLNNIKLDKTKSVEAIRSYIVQHKIELVIVDSMVRVMEGEEERSKDVRRIFDHLKPIIKELNTTFIILHHTTKNAKRGDIDSVRGSGDFQGQMNTVMLIHANGRFANIYLPKIRDLDKDDIKPFSILFENTIERNVKLRYIEGLEEQKDLVASCAECLQDWFDNDKITQFKSKLAWDYVKTNGFRKNTLYQALNMLKENKNISKLKRGLYQVNDSQNTDDKE